MEVSPGGDPIQWLLGQFPGGDVGLAAAVLLAVIVGSVIVTRGSPVAAPLAMVGTILSAGLLHAFDLTSAPVMAVMMVLGGLGGVALLRVSRV